MKSLIESSKQCLLKTNEGIEFFPSAIDLNDIEGVDKAIASKPFIALIFTSYEGASLYAFSNKKEAERYIKSMAHDSSEGGVFKLSKA